MSNENPFKPTGAPPAPEASATPEAEKRALGERQEGEVVNDLLARIVENAQSLKDVFKDHFRFIVETNYGLIKSKEFFSKVYKGHDVKFGDLVEHAAGHSTGILSSIVVALKKQSYRTANPMKRRSS